MVDNNKQKHLRLILVLLLVMGFSWLAFMLVLRIFFRMRPLAIHGDYLRLGSLFFRLEDANNVRPYAIPWVAILTIPVVLMLSLSWVIAKARSKSGKRSGIAAKRVTLVFSGLSFALVCLIAPGYLNSSVRQNTAYHYAVLFALRRDFMNSANAVESFSDYVSSHEKSMKGFLTINGSSSLVISDWPNASFETDLQSLSAEILLPNLIHRLKPTTYDPTNGTFSNGDIWIFHSAKGGYISGYETR
jgi:hypothetical protein